MMRLLVVSVFHHGLYTDSIHPIAVGGGYGGYFPPWKKGSGTMYAY